MYGTNGMYEICQRCNGKMDDEAVENPVRIDDEDPELEYVVPVCKQCREDAALIDKAFAEACAKAKLIWLRDPSIELSNITSIQSVRDFLAKS